MRGGLLLACGVVLIAESSCAQEQCSQAACGSGPSVTVLLTAKNSGQTVPVTPGMDVGVLLPGKAVIVVSDVSKLASVAVANQPSNHTFRIFRPISEPVPGQPWAYGGKVSLSSPADGTRDEWHVTILIGTDPPWKWDGWAADPSSFLSVETNLAPGQTLSLNWPLGLAPPSSSDQRVIAPITGVITLDLGHANIRGDRVTAGPSYQTQLFAAVGTGTAVLIAPHATNSVCYAKRTNGNCLERTTVYVEPQPGWNCSADSGCIQVNWDGVSRNRPDQYQH
jgi:hypothetical protein